MSRRHDINDINLSIYKIEPIKNGLCVQWNSSIGFGEYSIWVGEDGKMYGDSEYMDSQDDKDFIRKYFKADGRYDNLKEIIEEEIHKLKTELFQMLD